MKKSGDFLKKIISNKKVKICLLILIPVLIIINILVSKFPLFYLSELTVERIDATHFTYEYELPEYNEYELCKILSTMRVGKKMKGSFRDDIDFGVSGSSYSRFKIKLRWNRSIYVGVHSTIPFCIVINDEKVYHCSADDYKAIDSLFNKILNKFKYDNILKGKI